MALIRKEFRCEECGFDNTQYSEADLVALIAKQAETFPAALDGVPQDQLAARPSLEVWSALEYAAHQRDVIAWYADRIERALTENRPQFTGYDFSVPSVVTDDDGAEIAVLATEMSDRLRSLDDSQWQRVGIGSIDGDERDVRNLASRVAHEGVHHLLDIEASLRAARP